MKKTGKFYLILSLFGVMALALAACGTSANNGTPTVAALGTTSVLPTLASTSVGGLPVTGGTAAATSVFGGATAVATTVPNLGGGATGATPMASGTPLATSTSALGAMATSTPGLPGTGNAYQTYEGMLTNILTLSVVNQNNNQIGTVSDLILNTCSNRVEYVIVNLSNNSTNSTSNGAYGAAGTSTPAASGVLSSTPVAPSIFGTATPSAGMSSANAIAIPWSDVTLSQNNLSSAAGVATTATPTSVAGGATNPAMQTTGALLLSNNVTSAKLNGAPHFNSNMATNGVLNPGWNTQFNAYWGLNGITNNTTCATTAPGMGGVSSTPGALGLTTTVTPVTPGLMTTSTPAMGTTSGTATGINMTVLASKFLGATVQDQSGNNVGTIANGIIQPSTGTITYAVLSPATNLNMDSKLVVIPMQAFTKNTNSSATNTSGNLMFTLAVSQSVLQNAPAYTTSNFPNPNNDGWDNNVISYWQSQNISIP